MTPNFLDQIEQKRTGTAAQVQHAIDYPAFAGGSSWLSSVTIKEKTLEICCEVYPPLLAAVGGELIMRYL